MEAIDFASVYDPHGLQRRLEENLVFSRTICTDALEIIHKPASNWDLDRLGSLIEELRAETIFACVYAAALIRAMEKEGNDRDEA